MLAAPRTRPYADSAMMRHCAKSGCRAEAVATSSFNYPLKQIWIAHLTFDPEPGAIDLCEDHADRFVAPIGWTLNDLRLHPESAAAGL
jgi:hypothetical protein